MSLHELIHLKLSLLWGKLPDISKWIQSALCLLFLERIWKLHYHVWKPKTKRLSYFSSLFVFIIFHFLCFPFSPSLLLLFQRTEKSKEYDLFVLKIQKLEKLCHALQTERAVLYDKIKEVRHANSNLPSKLFGSSKPNDITDGADKSALTPAELQELQQLQEEDPVLTEDMSRLREEQAKLQQFADSLLATPADNDEEVNNDLGPEEDLVASAFVQFKTKTQVKERVVSVPEQVVNVKSEAAEKVEEVPKPAMSTPEAPTPVENTSEMIPTDAKPEAVKDQTQVEDKEVQLVKPDEEIQQHPAEPAATPEPEKVKINPPTDLQPEAAEAETLVEAGEVKPVIPVEDKKVQAESVQVPEEAPTKSESATPSENTPKTTASTNVESSKKQTPKKKKKRNGKNAS